MRIKGDRCVCGWGLGFRAWGAGCRGSGVEWGCTKQGSCYRLQGSACLHCGGSVRVRDRPPYCMRPTLPVYLHWHILLRDGETFSRDIDTFWDDIETFWDDIDTFWDDIDTFWDDIETFSGGIETPWDMETFWDIETFFWGMLRHFQETLGHLYCNRPTLPVYLHWGILLRNVETFPRDIGTF